LASTSAYRRALLERLRLPFTVESPQVDEWPLAGEAPLALALRLARAKALAVALRHPGACVVGSDQVAVLGEPATGAVLLGKPGSAQRCADQLRQCSGRSAVFLTAVAVVAPGSADARQFHDCTRVRFRELDETSITRYVALDAPLDCAGGFKAESLGVSLLEEIESKDPTALIGLPLIRLAAELRGVGYELP
jgi:septum formation protein